MGIGITQPQTTGCKDSWELPEVRKRQKPFSKDPSDIEAVNMPIIVVYFQNRENKLLLFHGNLHY